MKTEVLTIPEFSKEDFLETSDPYAWLSTFDDDPFLLKQMLQRMKDKAGAVGVKSFMALYNAYRESLASQRGTPIGQVTQFDGQELELLSGQYVCDEMGVSIADKYGYEQYVCRHPIMPTQRLVNIDSGEERMKMAFKKGRFWRSIIVEKSVIASSNQILQLAANGVFVNSENAKDLSTYLMTIEQLNYDTIPEQISVSRLGWVGDNGFSPYVDGLTFDGENNYRHIFNAVRCNGDREKWLEAMRLVRAEKTTARIALAASFASALLDPCGLLPFFCHAWGGTENGKTVLLMVAASVWACPKLGEYVTTWNSTGVGQEVTASFLNSLPMCIDELQIQSSQGIRDFDKTVYQLTEGVGRTRGSKHGGLQKQNTWKNCFITNGEHPLSNTNSGGGAVNRIIEFEVTEKIYHDLVGLCSVINQNYGFAGREFVDYLQTDGALDRVNTLQKEFYRELLKSDSTEKQAASASVILAADAIATELLFKDDNALTISDLSAVLTKKEDVSANNRALDYIFELVERNPMHFKPNEFGEYKGEVWGKTDHENVYFIKSVFDSEMSLAGYNSTSFLSWAKRHGYLDCDKDGRRTKKAKICDSVVNTICIVKNAQTENENLAEINKVNDELPF